VKETGGGEEGEERGKAEKKKEKKGMGCLKPQVGWRTLPCFLRGPEKGERKGEERAFKERKKAGESTRSRTGAPASLSFNNDAVPNPST